MKMAPEHFIVLLLLAPCLSVNIDQIDTAIENLMMKDEVLQDSVTYLLKKREMMQIQLDNLTLHQPNPTEIASLKNDVKKWEKQIVQLLQWTRAAKEKLDHPNCTMNTTLLNKRLQPVNDEVDILKDQVEQLSQRESAVQIVVVKQGNDIGLLFTKIKEIKAMIVDITAGMAKTMRYIKDSVERSKKNVTDLKDELTKRMNKQNNATNSGFKLVFDMIQKTKTTPSII